MANAGDAYPATANNRNTSRELGRGIGHFSRRLATEGPHAENSRRDSNSHSDDLTNSMGHAGVSVWTLVVCEGQGTMMKVTLPPGKKPLATIRRVFDAVDRVEDYGKLLEWLLVSNFPPPETGKEQEFLGDYVQHYSYKFAAISDVNFALGVYNDIKHTNTKRGRPPEAHEIERAAKHLDAAIEQLLLTLPDAIRKAVLIDPYVQQAKKAGAVIVLGLAMFGMVALVGPRLFMHRTDADRGIVRPMSHEEFAKQQWELVERAARDTHNAIGLLEEAIANWNLRWTELSSGSDGRRLASSPVAVRAIAELSDRPRIKLDEAKAMRSEVDQALEPLRKAQKDRNYSRTEFGESTSRLSRLRGRAQQGTADCNSANALVDQWLTKVAASQPAPVTLEQAVRDLREADRSAKLEAERKEAEERAKVLAAKSKLIEGRKVAFDKEQQSRREEYQPLKVLADDPATRELFAPFLAHGVRFPRSNKRSISWQNEQGRQPGPPGPIGYEWLVSSGVLESADVMIAVATSEGNDRARWPAPRSDAERDEYRKRHNILVRVAPLWHDMGLLGARPEKPHRRDSDEWARSLEPFQGEWRQSKYDFDVAIVGDIGVMTRGSTPDHHVGEDALRIESVNGVIFTGTHIWSDGRWEPVSGELSNPNLIRLNSASLQWTMERQ